jgi:hypothetical protein
MAFAVAPCSAQRCSALFAIDASSLRTTRTSSRTSSPTLGATSPSRPSLRKPTTAIYLDTDQLDVAWDKPDRRGSFGRVFFARQTTSDTNVVIKCPMENDKARTLWNVEEHVNAKLMRIFSGTESSGRWAEYLGKVIVPREAELSPGLSRVGLVWRYVGRGETLEEYLNSNNMFALDAAMKASTGPCTAWVGRLRVQLAERVLIQLVFLLRDLAQAGVIHRLVPIPLLHLNCRMYVPWP